MDAVDHLTGTESTVSVPRATESPSIAFPPVDENTPLGMDPQTSATEPLRDHLRSPYARIHEPPSAPPHSDSFMPSVGADQPTTAVELPPYSPSAPIVAASPNSEPPANAAGQHPSSEPDSPPNLPAMSVSILEGANDVTLNNSLITNVKGNFNPTIFKFDGSECTQASFTLTTHRVDSRFRLDVSLTEELRSLVRSSLRVWKW